MTNIYKNIIFYILYFLYVNMNTKQITLSREEKCTSLESVLSALSIPDFEVKIRQWISILKEKYWSRKSNMDTIEKFEKLYDTALNIEYSEDIKYYLARRCWPGELFFLLKSFWWIVNDVSFLKDITIEEVSKFQFDFISIEETDEVKDRVEDTIFPKEDFHLARQKINSEEEAAVFAREYFENPWALVRYEKAFPQLILDLTKKYFSVRLHVLHLKITQSESDFLKYFSDLKSWKENWKFLSELEQSNLLNYIIYLYDNWNEHITQQLDEEDVRDILVHFFRNLHKRGSIPIKSAVSVLSKQSIWRGSIFQEIFSLHSTEIYEIIARLLDLIFTSQKCAEFYSVIKRETDSQNINIIELIWFDNYSIFSAKLKEYGSTDLLQNLDNSVQEKLSMLTL